MGLATAPHAQAALTLRLALVTSVQVQQKVFIANVTTQVIERHMLRDLDHVFSPVVVANMSDDEVASVTIESPAVQRQRIFLSERISKLEEGRSIFTTAMGSVAVLRAQWY
ncbi:uncharacterized protein PpBr36_11272 [Pyricularia pennisetigena]|uniref:uncharacterized protein n=1 Tax=Pyricularia pennisetigena TaxID=1578925 RepID=UPI00114DE136|nr:uncharacterized protein PpBr36_11272 [Pyricularia pennisetigena]TLS20446.1 hypothetical protein PpBr36_11272 [Pyricularia pennisetigena]